MSMLDGSVCSPPVIYMKVLCILADILAIMAKSDYLKSDYWSLKAHKEGYPARSVYKLEELASKFSLVDAKQQVLDLGASPGSWSKWLLERLSSKGSLCAVDLNPMAEGIAGNLSSNFCFIQGDLLDKGVLEKVSSKGPYDLIVSDAAPLTSGNRTIDTARSCAIVEMVLYYAACVLKKGGNLVAKSFEGSDSPMLLVKLKGLFSMARTFKPKACRDNSFETYLIGKVKK